jgi:hypothetical protein
MKESVQPFTHSLSLSLSLPLSLLLCITTLLISERNWKPMKGLFHGGVCWWVPFQHTVRKAFWTPTNTRIPPFLLPSKRAALNTNYILCYQTPHPPLAHIFCNPAPSGLSICRPLLDAAAALHSFPCLR